MQGAIFHGLYLSCCPVDHGPDFQVFFFAWQVASQECLQASLLDWAVANAAPTWRSIIRALSNVGLGVSGIDLCEIVGGSIIRGRNHKNGKTCLVRGMWEAMFTGQKPFHEQLSFMGRSRFPEALGYEDACLPMYLAPIHACTFRGRPRVCIGLHYCCALLVRKNNRPLDDCRHGLGSRGNWESSKEFEAS